MFINAKRSVPSSVFGFQKDTGLFLYKSNPQKNELMLSTFYSGDYIDPESGELQKPKIVTFYNLTKGNVDVWLMSYNQHILFLDFVADGPLDFFLNFGSC